MKKVIAFVLIILVVLSLTSCNEASSVDEERFSSNTTNNSAESDNLEINKTYPTILEADVYDLIVFGKYEQDNNASNGAEDIEWLVLEKTDNSALLITDKIIDMSEFNLETAADWDIEYTEADWSSSDLRRWLNSNFYDIAFSDKEQERIINTSISTPDNPENGTSGGPDTEDKVFLLSSQEAEKHLVNPNHLHPDLTSVALKKYNEFQSKTFILQQKGKGFWLRTRGKQASYTNISGNKTSVRGIVGVSDKQHYGIFNLGYNAWDYMGVRPAIYVEF